MWLVLCKADDVPALWAYQGLKARGLTPLELVSADVLTYALRWEHRLRDNQVSTEITLANGRIIHSGTTYGVLNRLTTLSSEHLRIAHASDQNYASQELLAFFTSWLYSLPCPVLNKPTPQGLAGQWRHASEWVWLASRSGLPTPHYKESSDDDNDNVRFGGRFVPANTPVRTIIVVAEQVVGASAPANIKEGSRRLARLSGTEILGVEFANGPSGPWTFAGATPFPDLRLGGDAFLNALLDALKAGRTSII